MSLPPSIINVLIILSFACLLGGFLCSGAVQAQGERSDNSSPSTEGQDSSPLSGDTNSPEQLPTLPQPPLLKDRPPIPTPPSINLPDIPDLDGPKPPLSWRAKAYVLGSELPSPGSSDKLVWSLPVSFDKGRQLLTSALNQTGFQLLASYTTAGHYLARLTGEEGGETQVIIVVQPIDSNLTVFKLRVLPGGVSGARKHIDDLPKVMNTILGDRGVL